MQQVNDHLVLVGGGAIQGKSASLNKLKEPEGVWYFNCEAGKKLPFRSKFGKEFVITDPYQIYTGLEKAEENAKIHTIVIDSQTYLMDMFESVYVLTAADSRSAWQDYQQYFKNLMQQYVSVSTKNVIFTAHTENIFDKEAMLIENKVPVKGALKTKGIESFFSTAVTAKVVTLEAVENYKNSLLTVTPEEEALGYKHVFQTRLTKETIHEKCVRAPMGMWEVQETFIDNNCQLVIDRLREYYK